MEAIDNKMKKAVLILILFLLNTQFLSGDSGSSAANFLLLDRGAANIGIGGNPNYFSKNIDILFYNPAMGASFKEAGASFSYSSLIEGFDLINFSAVLPTAFSGVFALNFSGLFYGDITGTIISGNEYEYSDREISASDMVIGFNYAYPFTEIIYAGAKAKIITGTLDTESYFNPAMDFGLMLNFIPNKLFAGIAVQNMGPGIKYVEESYSLPVTLNLSGGMKIFETRKKDHSGTVFSSLLLPYSENVEWKIGAEYSFFELISLRVGYRFGSDTSRLTLGTGMNYKKSENIYKIDYGFILNNYIGSTHIVSVQFLYDMFPKEESLVSVRKMIKDREVRQKAFKMHYTKALGYYQKSDYNNAANYIQQALSLYSSSRKAINLQIKIGAGVLFNKGVAMYELGEYDGAIKKFTRALTLDPDLKKAQEYLEKCEDKKKEIEKPAEESLYCTSCEKSIPGKAIVFCPYCGKKLEKREEKEGLEEREEKEETEEPGGSEETEKKEDIETDELERDGGTGEPGGPEEAEEKKETEKKEDIKTGEIEGVDEIKELDE